MESPAKVLLGFYCFYQEGQNVAVDSPALSINPRRCLASFAFGGFSFLGFGFGTFAFALCLRVFPFLSFAGACGEHVSREPATLARMSSGRRAR